MRGTNSTEPAGITKHSLRMRAVQVFAHLLSRDDEPFRRYHLTAPLATIQRWLAKFHWRKVSPACGGRPELPREVVDPVAE